MTTVVDLAKLAAAAAESENTSVDSSGFVRELPKVGNALVRLRDYIEFGKQEPSAAGKAQGYNNSYKARLTFELLHKKHIQIVGDDKKEVPHTIDVYVNKGATAKSGFKKLFKSLNAATGGTAKTFLDLVGKLSMATVVHSKPEKEGEKPKYANLDNGGSWTFREPVRENDDGEEVQIQCRELMEEPRIFLWENETMSDEMVQAMWASIYREGTYTKGEGDAATEASLNFDQEKVMANIEWEGSRTQSLVMEDTTITLDGEDDLDVPEDKGTSNDDDLDGMDLDD
jgi:hypothetical protein